MLSTSTKYVLRAVLYLAVNSSENKKVLAKDISGPTNIPKAYLSKLLQELSKHRIVSSIRGPGGGFYLTPENKKVPLIHIVQVIDGDSRLNSCMLSVRDCDEDHPCPIHHLVGDAKTNFIKNLKENSLEDLVKSIQNGDSVLPL